MWAAKGLTETCYLAHAVQPWELCPDDVLLVPGRTPWMQVMKKWGYMADVVFDRLWNHFMFCRGHGEQRWREYAWRILESIEKHAKTFSVVLKVPVAGTFLLAKFRTVLASCYVVLDPS
ncbi:hypothetical protein BJ322DRAFT_782375 [Thelephora terrestris]|uniref:Uncharacterized protein n=1 Tax=Thelephora terrestris TaxID=56493 RepID=A0A9P6HGD6_9AGAM|nr:hypothetical protein BJ322DRAFT_782375 [Thelephora terrestris]